MASMPRLIENKKAHLSYEILEKFEAGLELFGFEVKSLKKGQGSLLGAYVSTRGNELFLVGATVPPYQSANTPKEYIATRARRLLLTAREIRMLIGREHERGLTIIPLSIYTKGPRIKIEIAVARGLKKFDKRQVIRKREENRRIEKLLKGGQ